MFSLLAFQSHGVDIRSTQNAQKRESTIIAFERGSKCINIGTE